MNVVLQAQNAYKTQTRTIRTDRDTEYYTFARVTYAIKTAAQRGAAGFADLALALHDNRRLWTVLAADVAEDDNPLPPELRARIVYLAEFTRQYSSRVLNGGASPAPLIEINSAIMQGLRERRGAP